MRTWLHVSEVDLGQQFLFVPRIPETRAECEDDQTPRICVSDSIKRCSMAIYGETRPLRPKTYFVYELRANVVKPTDWQVPDQYRTNEHWILSPTVGVRRH